MLDRLSPVLRYQPNQKLCKIKASSQKELTTPKNTQLALCLVSAVRETRARVGFMIVLCGCSVAELSHPAALPEVRLGLLLSCDIAGGGRSSADRNANGG